MADIAPELLEKIERQFFDEVSYGKEIGKLEVLIVDGVATYKEVEEYAVKVGEALAQAFRDNLSSDILPDGKMYFNIANRVIRGPMENLHEIVSEAAEQVQQALNEAAGIRIKPQSPELDTDRIDGIINRISSEDRFDDIAWILDEPVVNFSQHVVDETIRKNVEFHAKSGFEPKVTRTADSGACKWCRERAGTFEYWEVKGKGDDVWQRHDNCRCLIEYIPKKGKRETVYNYREGNTPEGRAAIERRKQIGVYSEAQKRAAIAERMQKASNLFRHALFKSPLPDNEESFLDSIGVYATDKNITAKDRAYVRNNIHQVSSKNNIGKVVTLASMQSVYVIELHDYLEYDILWKIPNEDSLNDAIARKRARR